MQSRDGNKGCRAADPGPEPVQTRGLSASKYLPEKGPGLIKLLSQFSFLVAFHKTLYIVI